MNHLMTNNDVYRSIVKTTQGDEVSIFKVTESGHDP